MPGLAEAFERIGSALEHHLPVTHAAGAVVLVCDRDEILGVVVRGFADAASGLPVRPETRFQIGSISKSFAGLVAVQEAEAGHLDLRASVNEVLPWLELPEPFGPVTLHHLLTHTSGLLEGTEEMVTAEAAALNLRRFPATYPPGERFRYSNDAYKLVGLALERVTGRPIHDLLRERVFEPLGMGSAVGALTDDVRLDSATGYQPVFQDRPPRLDHPLVPERWFVCNTADGSIVTSAIDLATYARLVLNGGDGVLSPEAFSTWTSGYVDDDEEPGFRYGYGWWVGERDGVREIRHTGGMVSHTASLWTLPDDGLACIVLQNGAGDRRRIVRFALDTVRAIVHGTEPPEIPGHADPASIPRAAEYVGRYEDELGSFVVEEEGGGRLRLTAGDAEAVLQRDPLDEQAEGFVVPHPDLERFPLFFGRNPEGVVVEAFHGNRWLRGERYSGPGAERHPEEWAAYPGLYRSANGWSPTVRVVLRKGRLALQHPTETRPTELELFPREDGWLAVGEPWSPSRLRFGEVVDGRAILLEIDGAHWYRSFEG